MLGLSGRRGTRHGAATEFAIETSIDHYAVIIVNWNAGAALRRCLDAVFASEGGDPHQVIVVDNASPDGSLLGLASVYPAVEIIQNDRNVGYARAVNQGLRASRGQHAVVLRLARRCPANGAIPSPRRVVPA